MRLTVKGQPWKLRFVSLDELKDCLGDCDKDTRTIRVLRTLRGKELLRVVAHEILHASGWHLSEAFVDVTSTDLADALAKCGFRRAKAKA